MKWELLTPWVMKCSDWTITKHGRPEMVPYPYGLYFMGKNQGYFETSEAAKAAAISIVAMQA